MRRLQGGQALHADVNEPIPSHAPFKGAGNARTSTYPGRRIGVVSA